MKKNIFQWVVFFVLYLNFKGLLFGQAFNFQLTPSATNGVITTQENIYGCGISTFDYDEDGWDDLTITSIGNPTRVYKNILGTYYLAYQFECGNNCKACLWGDIDEDGDNDLFIVGYLCASTFYEQQPNGSFINETTSKFTNFPTNQNFIGANFQDLNRDGYLDLIVYNWSSDSGNLIWLNHGGTYFESINIAPLTNIGKSSFQGSFTDADDDSFADLFVANDHFNGNDFIHFHSDSTQLTYSISNTLSIPGNSMSASWGDFDNDLDEDVYISNGMPFEDHLAINQGEFNFESVGMGTNDQDGWCATWCDVNNDGWLDLFVSTVLVGESDSTNQNHHNRFYENQNGQLALTNPSEMPAFPEGSYTHSLTDFDHDGKLDLIIANKGESELQIFKNENTSNHHFLNFRFSGRWSNRNAIGTKYNLFASNQTFEGYVRSGENFMVQKSQTMHIGLGDGTNIDSLVVFWPSGLKEKYTNLIIDQNNTIIEGSSLSIFNIDSVNCQNQHIQLSTYAFPEFAWSDGSNEISTQYAFSDNVFLTTQFPFGHAVEIPFQIPAYGTANFDYWLNAPTCETSNDGNLYFSYLYQPTQEIQTSFMQNLMVGDTSIVFEYDEGCYHTEHISIAPLSHFKIDSIQTIPNCPDMQNGQVLIHTSNGYFDPPIPSNSFVFDSLLAGDFSVAITDDFGCEITIDTLVSVIGAVTITSQSPDCIDATNGWITIDFQSNWNGAMSQTQILDSLPTGIYSGIFNYTEICQYPYSITLDPLETIQISVDLSAQICAQDSILFDPEYSTNSNWIWTSSLQPNQWINWPGIYPISVMSELGCTWDSILEITTAPTPIYTIDFDDNLIIINPISFSSDNYSCSWPDGSVGWTHSWINDNSLTIQITSLEFGCSWDTTLLLSNLNESIDVNHWQQQNNHLQYTGKKQGYCIVYNSLGQEIQRCSPLISGQEFKLPLGELCIIRTPEETTKVVTH